MKKIWNALIVLMLIASIAPLVFADEVEDSTDDVEIDAETQKQVEAMNNGIGAEIRLLQLEKSITINIFKGEEIVSNLAELGFNTTELLAILFELELLKGEVVTADPNATDAVQIFVDLKHDAVNLTKDFRDTLKESLDDDTIEQIRERIREMICEQAQNLSKNIQNKIRQFNRNQFHRVYQILGENGDSVLNQYQNGTLTMNQVKQQIQKMVNQMIKEKRYDLFSQLKQEKIHNQIKAKNCVQNASEGFQTREESRLQKRLHQSETMSDNPVTEEASERIRNRINCIGDAGTGSDDNNSPVDNGSGNGAGDGDSSSSGNEDSGTGNGFGDGGSGNPGNGYYGGNGTQQSGGGNQ